MSASALRDLRSNSGASEVVKIFCRQANVQGTHRGQDLARGGAGRFRTFWDQRIKRRQRKNIAAVRKPQPALLPSQASATMIVADLSVKLFQKMQE